MNNNMNNEENNNANVNQAVNHSPYVKLSLENDDIKNFQAMDEETRRRMLMENNNGTGASEIDQLTQQVKSINDS